MRKRTIRGLAYFAAAFVIAGPCFAQDDSARRFGIAEAPARTLGTLRLATYNVLNLFDDVDDPNLFGRNEDIDDTKPESELVAVARAIRLIDADILALEEIESKTALMAFVDEYISDMGYDYIVSVDSGDPRGIENALLSRYPIQHIELWPGLELGGVHPELFGNRANWYAGQPLTFKRSPIRVDVRVPGEDDEPDYLLSLFVVHHKASRGNDYWREAEAGKLIELIQGLESKFPERNIAVLGDFNATPEAKSIGMYIKAGLVDLFGPGSEADSGAWVTHESGRRIDYVFVNKAFASETRDGGRFVLGTPARPEGADWRTTPAPAGYASDHYPLVVEFWPREGLGRE